MNWMTPRNRLPTTKCLLSADSIIALFIESEGPDHFPRELLPFRHSQFQWGLNSNGPGVVGRVDSTDLNGIRFTVEFPGSTRPRLVPRIVRLPLRLTS